MSADKFEKKYRGYAYSACRPEGNFDLESVHDATAVGMDEAPRKSGIPIDESSLPSSEDDRPCVLRPGAVLRQDIRPLLPTRFDHRAAGSSSLVDTSVRHDLGDGVRGSLDDLRIAGVERETQLEAAARRREIAVTEVQTEQIHICRCIHERMLQERETEHCPSAQGRHRGGRTRTCNLPLWRRATASCATPLRRS